MLGPGFPMRTRGFFMSEQQRIRQEREQRIAELEARLARRSRGGVKPLVALVAIGVSLALLWMQRRELRYFFSSGTPLTLGAEGDYRYEALVSNRYAQLHGIPTSHGAYERDGDAVYVLVGLRESAFVVRRPALPGEQWVPGKTPPPPDPRPFAVRGRLLAEEDAPRYQEAFALLRSKGEVLPLGGRLWLIIEGQRPWQDWGRMLGALLLLLFAGANVVFLIRGLRRTPAA